MRSMLLLAALALASATLTAQQTGRHFQRPERLPVTPAAQPEAAQPQTAEASAPARVAPERRLRSGRAWSSFRFGRLPRQAGAGEPGYVEASAKRPHRRTPFWGRPLRSRGN